MTGGSVDFGLNIVTHTPSNLIWPDHYAIIERAPVFDIRTNNLPEVLIPAINEGRVIATDFQLFLRKVTTDGEPIADVTAAHVKLTIAAGVIEPAETSGEHGSIGETGIRVVSASSTTLAIAIAAIT